MIDIIKSIVELLGKQLWLLLGGSIVVLIALLSITLSSPIGVSINYCIQKDNSYELHKITYEAKGTLRAHKGPVFNLCITELVKKVTKE